MPTQYPDAASALEALKDGILFERVSSALLLDTYRELEPKAGAGDRGRDAVLRRGIFGAEEILFQYSIQSDWVGKLRRELARHDKDPALPQRVVFVTSRPTKPDKQDDMRDEARAKGLDLTIYDREWLAQRLDWQRRDVAETLLNVRPHREPTWEAPAEKLAALTASPLPGYDAHYSDPDRKTRFIAARAQNRIVMVVGPGGIGKTRLALDALRSDPDARALKWGQSFTNNAVADLRPGVTSTVVVDDAHRVSDLSGLCTLLDSPRWRGWSVVLTVRPGYERQVQDQLGPLHPCHIFNLQRLSDDDIDLILTSSPYTIVHEGLRRLLIQLAGGVPLIAHLAASLPLKQRLYVGDAATVLRHYLDRLMKTFDHRHHALVGVIALFGGLDLTANSTALAAALQEPELTVRQMAFDLADAGVLWQEGDFYVPKPDTVGHIMVADAFFPANQRPLLSLSKILAPKHVGPEMAERVAEAVVFAEMRGKHELVGQLGPTPRTSGAAAWKRVIDLYAGAVRALPDELAALLTEFCKAWPAIVPEDEQTRFGIRTCKPEQAMAAALTSAERLVTNAEAHVATALDAAAAGCMSSVAIPTSFWKIFESPTTDTRGRLLQALVAWYDGGPQTVERADVALQAATRLATPGAESQHYAPANDTELRLGYHTLLASPLDVEFLSEAAAFYVKMLKAGSHKQQLAAIAVADEYLRVGRGYSLPFGRQPSPDMQSAAITVLHGMLDELAPSWLALPLTVRRGLSTIGTGHSATREAIRADEDLRAWFIVEPDERSPRSRRWQVRSFREVAWRSNHRAMLLAQSCGYDRASELLRMMNDVAPTSRSLLGLARGLGSTASAKQVAELLADVSLASDLRHAIGEGYDDSPENDLRLFEPRL